jgi:hypothetical protein
MFGGGTFLSSWVNGASSPPPLTPLFLFVPPLLFSLEKMLMYIGYGLPRPFYLQWSVFEGEW